MDWPHVQISQLWEYSRHPSALESVHLEHLVSCEGIDKPVNIADIFRM
jgi:hypothetical protein